MTTYCKFLDDKAQIKGDYGFSPLWLPDFLYDFQTDLINRALCRGRSAVFADCGLGKTPMQLVWGQNVVQKTNKPVLILTPLAVSAQTVQEGGKFRIECDRAKCADDIKKNQIYVTNYENLHNFIPDRFGGVICDESSILKNFRGATKIAVTAFMRKIPYRLLATATAAPNDYHELGTSSEALGVMGYMDVLNRFFSNNQNNSATGRQWGSAAKWRFKGHAEEPFWRWVCSWSTAIKHPSDLGYSDEMFNLPKLIERETVVESRTLAPGMLFSLPAVGLDEQREERRRTIPERCEKAANIASSKKSPVIIWCHLNDEADLLCNLLPEAIQVKGSQSTDEKERILTGFKDGEFSTLVTKPKIGAWGLNYQHCNRIVTFPSHSFEQYYQAVRRCWRFGQTKPVTVDMISSEGEAGVLKNLQRKSDQAERMFTELVKHINGGQSIINNQVQQSIEVPKWL